MSHDAHERDAVPKGNFDILSMWWDDTDQHRYGLAAYLRMRSQRGDTIDVLLDDLVGRTDGRLDLHRATVGRWLRQINDGQTPS